MLFSAPPRWEYSLAQNYAHACFCACSHVVDPSELRVALDELGVRAGEMNDASEVMSALFESLNRAPGLSGADPTVAAATAGGGLDTLPVVDRTFGLLLSEEVRCTVSTCCRITHVVPQHIEYFIIITATGLRDMRSIIDLGKRGVGGLWVGGWLKTLKNPKPGSRAQW